MSNQIIKFTNLILILLSAFTLFGCGGGGGATFAGGGGGGVVGTGKQVVVGEVTGFGSVIVNGVEFFKSTAPGVSATPVEFPFDNSLYASENVLRPGMQVTVSGSYDVATGKGSYSRIVFSPELRGLLDNGSVSTVGGSFSLLGRAVQVGTSTIFDGIADINEMSARQNQGLELEVSGFLNSVGTVQASRIALKSSGFSGGKVQLKGTVSSTSPGSFAVGTLTVSTIGASFVGMTASDLVSAGVIVEVRGTLNGTVVNNARIERKSSVGGVLPDDSLNIKGVADGVPVAGKFMLSGPDGPVQVSMSGAVFRRGNLTADSSIVVPGALLEVEGAVLPDGTLTARKISVESEKTVRLEGDISGINVSAGSLTVNGVTLSTTGATSYRDSSSLGIAVLTLSGLSVGEHLQVYGFLDGSGKAVASQIERFNANSTAIVQGQVSAINLVASQLAILGVTVQSRGTLSKGSTVFPDFSSFTSNVTAGSTIVKAKGSWTGTGLTATSLEIQP